MNKSALKQYSFYQSYILRAPMFASQMIRSREELVKWAQMPRFKNALFIASPSLYKFLYIDRESELSATTITDKEIITLLRYINRAQNRATPFGLFAGVSVRSWDDTFQDSEQTDIYGRLDSRIYFEIINKLESEKVIRHQLHYALNNSCFKHNACYYFLDNTDLYKNEVPKEIEVPSTAHLDSLVELLKQGPQSFDALRDFLCKGDDALTNFAVEYLDQLISSKVLLSSLSPSIFEDFTIDKILKTIVSVEGERVQSYKTYLANIDLVVKKIKHPETNLYELNEQLGKELARFEINASSLKHSLVQVDTQFSPSFSSAAIEKSIQYRIKEVIGLQYQLYKKFVGKPQSLLDQYKSIIKRRFEHEGFPLALFFNGKYGNDYSFQKDSLTAPFDSFEVFRKNEDKPKAEVVPYVAFLKELYKKHEGKQEIDLSKELVYKGVLNHTYNLPPSFGVIGSPLAEGKFLFDTCYPYANKLINRFAFCSSDIRKIVKEVSQKEMSVSEEDQTTLMELDFIPEHYLANVSLRDKTYLKSLSFMTYPSANSFKDITISDVGIRFDFKRQDLILYHLETKEELVPVLNCALNFKLVKAPIVRFLALYSLARFDSSLPITWKPIIKEYQYFPRLTFKDIIFEPMSWIIEKDAISNFIHQNKEESLTYLKSLGIPDQFYIEEGDQTLCFNLCSYHSIAFFKASIKGKNSIRIYEDIYKDVPKIEVILPLTKN